MSDTVRAGTVRVQAHGTGAGFILSPSPGTFLIVTCVHVLGQPLPPAATVMFYPSHETREVSVDPAHCYEDHDVAFLYLSDPLPEGAQELLLGTSKALHSHPIRAFGFPPSNAYAEGRWGQGIINGMVDSPAGYKFLQISSDQITQGFSGSAVWDESRQKVVGIVAALQRADEWGKGGENVYVIPTETLRELSPDLKLEDVCPYRGLQPFREQDATYFFGREQYIEELLHCLKVDKRLLAILGPIGSGKTSVVQAGLIPQLRENGLPRSECWEIMTLPTTQDPSDPFSLYTLFSNGERLTERIKSWQQDHPDRERLVLIFDHFEHIFAPAYNDICGSFLDEFVTLIESDLVTVILIMRDDYYSVLAEHTPLIKLVEHCLCNIPAMTEKNILSVIQKPAIVEGIRFEAGLASTIAQDATRSIAEPVETRQKRHSTVLPSLSFCLRELWEKRVDNTLSFLDYQSLGGVFGALPSFANNIYATLTESQQQLARRIFTDLVDLGDERTGRFESRRQKTLSALCRQESERVDVHEVIIKFAQAGLLETSLDDSRQEMLVRIIHEMVLREWALLRRWLREDHLFLSWYHEMQSRTQRWVASHALLEHRDQDLLLRGRDLTVAATWLEERAADIHSDVQAFIRASDQLFEQEVQHKKRFEEVQQQQQVALAKQLATQAQLIEIQHPSHMQRSLLLAVEALRRYPCIEADQAVRRGLNFLPLYLFRLTRPSSLRLVTFGSDGSTLAVADQHHIIWTHAVSERSHFKQYPLLETTSIALSDDGYYLLAAGKDCSAWLIDTVQERPLLRFLHAQRVCAAALSHDHPSLAVTASDDMTIGIWDVSDASQFASHRLEGVAEAQRRHLLRHEGIRALAFSPDDRYLATVGADQKARIWDVSSGVVLAILEYQRPITLVTFSPDGAFVACADDEHTAIVWQWEQQRKQRRWGKKHVTNYHQCSHLGVIRALAFSPDGRSLLTASHDATARVWDLNDGSELHEIRRFEHQGPINAACFHPTGQFVATASEDHTARIWDVGNGQAIHYLPQEGPVTSVAFHPKKPYIVTGDAKGELVLWETGRSSLVTCFRHEGRVKDFFMGASYGKYHLRIATEEQDRLQLSDFREGDHALTTTFQGLRPPGLMFALDGQRLALYNATAIVFSPDGRFVAAAHENGEVKVWDTMREQRPVSLPHHSHVSTLIFSAHGQYLAIGCQNGTTHIWEWKCSANVVQLPHPDVVSAGAFTPDGSSLVTVCEDGRVRVWKWKERCQCQMVDLPHQECHVSQAIVSPAGDYLLTVSQGHEARVWDLATGSLISYKGHQDIVLAATFSPDGAYVATACRDGTAGIWETTTDRQLARLEHQSSVYACTFSPDGKYLITASDNHQIGIWLWRPDDLIREANRHLTRNLTKEEWQLYVGNEPYRKTCLYLGWRESPLKDAFSGED